MDVVLAHDWLTGMRGGERVLEILCRGFPNAPLVAMIHDPAAMSAVINNRTICTSWLQRLPGITRHYRCFLPLFPAVVASMKAPPSQLLISTSHCLAKSVRPAENARHLCYCFTPMRYAWTFYGEYFGSNPLTALLAKPLLAWLRRWDRATSNRVHRFVAISRHVRRRIRRFYGRDADVVYPPVDTDKWFPDRRVPPEPFDLVVSAIVPYKRVDLAVRAYTRTGHPLRVVGAGSGIRRIMAGAGPNIVFEGWMSDREILDRYRRCRMLVFPGEEDFGLVPLEAQACGRPVVAFGCGGARETVVDGVTGLFFDEQSPESLIDAVERCAAREWDSAVIRAHAERFNAQAFVDGLSASINACLDGTA